MQTLMAGLDFISFELPEVWWVCTVSSKVVGFFGLQRVKRTAYMYVAGLIEQDLDRGLLDWAA